MKKLSPTERQRQLDYLSALPDDQIDTSDIPELNAEQLRQMAPGLMFRPRKKPVTIRLDADVLAWLKEDGKGYQTKANMILRREMMRAHSVNKKPSTNAPSPQRHKKAR